MESANAWQYLDSSSAVYGVGSSFDTSPVLKNMESREE